MLDDLLEIIGRIGIRYRKELQASPEVVTALREISVPPPPPLPGQPDMHWLAGIDVIEDERQPPGSWTLISHSGCEVIHDKLTEPRVSHARCAVIGFGTIEGEDHADNLE